MFNSPTNKFLFDLIKLEPKYTISSLVLGLSTTSLNLIGTMLLVPILYSLIGNQELASSLEQVKFFAMLSEFRLPVILTYLLLIIIVKNIINYLNNIFVFKHNKFLVSYLKNQALESLTKVNLNYFQINKTNDILVKLNREIETAGLAIKSIQAIFIISLILLIHLSLLVFISWQLTLVTIILIGAIIWLNNWLIIQVQKGKYKASEKSQTYNYQLLEFLTGMRLIRTVANELNATQTVAQAMEQKDRAQYNTQLIAATIKPMIEVGITLLILIIISYYLANPNPVAITPILFLYLIVFARLLPFLGQFNNARLQYINTRSSIDVVAQFLTESTQPITLTGKLHFSKLQAGIKFDEITFAYPQHARIILDKIRCYIPQGQTTALVSFSGTEQSIIADLLIQLYEPIAGTIFLDGRELAAYEPSSLRQAIAIVNQHPFLFNNSLAYNLSYGVDNVTQGDLVNAAKQAQIYQFIEQLPAGLATELGRGIVLSAAQKQGISLARAFLRHPEIVIIQEPILTPEFSPTVLDHLCDQRTAIIMTKQLDIAQRADQIMVFYQGKIQEIGTHEQLLQPGTLYQRLYTKQFKTSQQDHQLKLARKIARKLAQQTQQALSPEIQRHYHALLNHLELASAGLINDELSQKLILDQSAQSAQYLLASLQEYERLIARDLDHPDY